MNLVTRLRWMAALALVAPGGCAPVGTPAESLRAEYKRVFTTAMADLDAVRSSSAQGCGHEPVADVREGIAFFVDRETRLERGNNAHDLERVRRYLWTLQFGLLDEAMQRSCFKLAEELQAALVEEYKEDILGNPDAKGTPSIETIREAMDL